MTALAPDELVCDMAETYHVLDWRALGLPLAATLAVAMAGGAAAASQDPSVEASIRQAQTDARKAQRDARVAQQDARMAQMQADRARQEARGSEGDVVLAQQPHMLRTGQHSW